MRKQLDARIAALIRSGIASSHRSFFVLVGDHSRDQIVNLHFLLSAARTSARPSVLWCYKAELGFTTHRKKREAKIKRDVQRGIRDKDSASPFELFVGVTDIRYCYYKETEKVLGNTYGMLVLQDFEALTPNLLARTIETVEGGGVVVLMLKTMSSLRQLYGVAMDVHKNYRTSFSSADPVARFNERFLLSLAACPRALFLDDELNVLPVSRGRDIVAPEEGARPRRKGDEELQWIMDETKGTNVVGDVVKHCKTRDQAKGVLTILDVLASSSLATTVALTAGRGRGKSAALGLCMAAAVAHGYANIFVTSPAPSNLRTLFEFLFKGLTALGYDEVSDWSVQRGVGEWKDAVVRVNIFRGHRQTIQYIDPADAHVLGQAELVVVDEAAAIPLALVRNLMGPYLVFLSSTINGYEGTGRSLSLKLIQQLREGASKSADDDDGSAAALVRKSTSSSSKLGAKALTAEGAGGALGARSLKEVTLDEPIRYGAGDAVEAWLHNLLCLDASLTPLSARGSPHPSSCTLYGINRDALFSYHPASEVFLQRVMALYVAAHYKNSPNDLQLMSDAPAHRLFVLLGPREGAALPEPLAVVQVALEGNIARDSVLRSMARGTRESGDLIPWSMSQQFQDADFAALSGARVVRIAVHPEHARAGYGSRAIECLRAFYAGELLDADALAARVARDAGAEEEDTFERARDAAPAAGLDADQVAVRDARRMPALLEKLEERRPEALDWLGVAFGHTPSLFRFWRRAGYVPLYVRQLASDLTGEHTSLMLRPLDNERPSWLQAFADDFARRFVALLSFRFRTLEAVSALTVLETAASASRGAGELGARLELSELRALLSPFDMKRLDGYANASLELPIVLDLLPTLASLYFMRRLRAAAEAAPGAEPEAATAGEEEEEELKLPALQSALLLAVGLQRKDISDVERELSLPRAQAGALFVKAVRRILASLRAIERAAARREMPAASADAQAGFKPLGRSLDDELQLAGAEAKAQLAEADKVRPASKLDGGLEKYAIRATDGWEEAEAQVARAMNDAPGRNTIVSLRADARDEAASPASEKGKKRKPDDAARRGKKHKGK